MIVNGLALLDLLFGVQISLMVISFKRKIDKRKRKKMEVHEYFLLSYCFYDHYHCD